MQTAATRLQKISRPKFLVEAAMLGLREYNRGRTLARVLRGENVPPPGLAFDVLWEREDALDQERRTEDAAYSPAKHIELLIALICEARLAEQSPG